MGKPSRRPLRLVPVPLLQLQGRDFFGLIGPVTFQEYRNFIRFRRVPLRCRYTKRPMFHSIGKKLLAVSLLAAVTAAANAQVALWLKNYSWGVMSAETAVDIVTDASGNIYSVGTTDGNVLVVSYTSAGTFRWANTYAGPGGGNDTPVEAVVDGSGHLYVVGTGSHAAVMGAFMVLKFDGATGGLTWSQLYTEFDPIFGDVSGPGKGICVGPGGFIYACGGMEVFNEFYDAITIRLSPTTGAVVNTALYGLPAAANQMAEDIVWDGSGALYVTGSTADNSNPYSPDASDIMLGKYTGSLGTVWVKTFDGNGKADYGRSVAVRRSINAVYVFGNFATDPATYPELCTMRINSISGLEVWRKVRATASDVYTGKMVLDSLGYLTVSARMDMFTSIVLRYRSTDGLLSWERFADGHFYDLVTDGSSNTIIVGERTAKLGSNGAWRWDNPTPGVACAVSPTNVVYTNDGPGEIRTIRWYQSSYTLTLTPSTTPGGANVTGRVTTSSTAPPFGLPFNITDGSPLVAPPASVTIDAGTTFKNFVITTSAVAGASDVLVPITASCYGATAVATLTLSPPTLASVSVTPDTVVGGNATTGKVTLTGIAPAGGRLVTLSDDSAFSVTPASATVSGGSASKTFTITTSATLIVRSVTITATLNGVIRTTTLTINP